MSRFSSAMKVFAGAAATGWFVRRVVKRVRRKRRRRDKMNRRHGREALVGKMCKIKSLAVNANSGQAQHHGPNGVTLILDVRCTHHNQLTNGSVAEIVAYHPGSDTYDVKPQ